MFSFDIPSLLIGASIPCIVYLGYCIYYRPIMPTNICPLRMAGSRAGDSVVMKRKSREKNPKRQFRETDSSEDKVQALLERKYKCDECFYGEE